MTTLARGLDEIAKVTDYRLACTNGKYALTLFDAKGKATNKFDGSNASEAVVLAWDFITKERPVIARTPA